MGCGPSRGFRGGRGIPTHRGRNKGSMDQIPQQEFIPVEGIDTEDFNSRGFAAGYKVGSKGRAPFEEYEDYV